MTRLVSPIGSEREYSQDEREFLLAVDRYRRNYRRPYPTCCEVLAILRSLGYRKVCEPGPAPVYREKIPDETG
jgi:hypothetical protein